MDSQTIPPADMPLTVTVQIPTGRPKNWGVHATTHHDAKKQMVRWNNDEWTKVEEWAKILNITPTQFVRDAADNMVTALNKLREQWNKDQNNAHSKHTGGG